MFGVFLAISMAVIVTVVIATSFVVESRDYARELPPPVPVREIDPAEVVRRIEKKQEREWVAEFESLLPKPEPEPIEYTNYCCCDNWTQRDAGGRVVIQSRSHNPRCGVHRNPWK